MNYTFIGDIHGCIEELELLYQEYLDSEIKRGHHLIFLGDIVDRGPESIKCIEFIYSLMKNYKNIFCLRGNHEDWYIRFNHHEKKHETLGIKNPMGNIDVERIQIAKEIRNNYTDWIESLPLYLKFPNLIAIHAGIPSIVNNYKDLSNKKFSSRVMRLRMIDEKGKMVELAKEQPHHIHWSAKYNGRFGHAIFGHSANFEIFSQKNSTGIDTACCYGGNLTAFTFNDKGEKINYHQVKAFRKYSESFV